MIQIQDSVISGELRSRLRDLGGDGDGFRCEVTFDGAFRGFEGHFEGNPVVPGVCLIELARIHAEELLKCSLTTTEIGMCRFRRPILAGETATCKLKVEPTEDELPRRRIRAEIRCGEALACQLRMTVETL